MADTTVALAAANMQLVAHNIVHRLMTVREAIFFRDPEFFNKVLFQLLEKTCSSPQPNLEEHILWDDIAILARYLLLLSFNNCLDGTRWLSKSEE